MDSQEVGELLEECLRAAKAADPKSAEPTEAGRLKYCSCRDLLCAELTSLLQEAMEMKWPFVPEKWQYKESVSANDKTNLNDLISKHLSQLLAVLKASIMAQEARTALAVVFLVDRFLYWTDESSRLLKITKLLHKHHRDTPVAPQLVIRQARVYFNTGKLQKAEYILSSLINDSGATGCWVYQSESEKALVQAVSAQVRGMILQKLGLWLEAAELIWASLVGFYALPQPDKKGIGTSLGILANILVSMNDEDFHSFRTKPDMDLSLLGDRSHRLLSAAQAAKLAVVYSQYTSLYVLTNVATQGTCLLSYSFSLECPASQKQSFLLKAKEAFEIGLLTKADGELVSSKQELHTFLKTAYSLAVTHKWLGTPQEAVAQATEASQKALGNFYDYCNADTQDKDGLCAEIMNLVSQVKVLLQVKPFLNSDKGSFIPDSYRNIEDKMVNFTLEGFAKVMQRFRKYHESVCETTQKKCQRMQHEVDKQRCITAFGTTVGTLNTECITEACKVPPKGEEPQHRGLKSSAVHPPHRPTPCTTQVSTDRSSVSDHGSSWQDFSLSSSGSPRPSNSGLTGSSGQANACNESCVTTEVDDDMADSMIQSTNRNRKRDIQGWNSGSQTVPRAAKPATSSSSSGSEKFEVIQADIETEASEDDWMTDFGVAQRPSSGEEAALSLSQLHLQTSSSSLSDSFGSKSSWEKISTDPNSPTETKPQPSSSLSKAGTSKYRKSPGSDESFFHLETRDCETSESDHDHTHNNHTSGLEFRPLQSLKVDPNMETEVDSESEETATKNSSAIPHPKLSQIVPEQCASTETSTDSSFEMLGEHQHSDVTASEKTRVPQVNNPLCYTCRKHSPVADVAKSQYLLTQQDYQALLAGVCHECLMMRLHSDKMKFKFNKYGTAYNALHLKFSKATGLWTARETCAYIGKQMNEKGAQREAIWVQFLHQEERLSSYVGKNYLRPMPIQFHLDDVERQMTAQYYVTEFNKSLYDKEEMAQIFFIPSEALLILKGDRIVGCVTVEPYMLGDFVHFTNNTVDKRMGFKATEYGLAFGHFTYLLSECQEVVVDLQGWVTANGKGLTYLTDPQIHSTKIPKGPSNHAAKGLKLFLEKQHGPECNDVCQRLKLPPVGNSHMVQL